MTTVTIELDEPCWTELNEKADLAGLPVERYIGALLKHHVGVGMTEPMPADVFRAAVEQTLREKGELYRRLAK